MSISELKKLVKTIYKEEKIKRPNIAKADRAELCEILGKTQKGLKLIQNSAKIIKKNDCENLGGLKNFLNSCYLDSLLLAILYKQNSYIDEKILNANLSHSYQPVLDVSQNIQEALKLIQNQIRTGQVSQCTELRNLFDLYQRKYNEYLTSQGKKPNKITNWKTKQNQPYEVWSYLSKIFNLKGGAMSSFIIMGTQNNISPTGIKAKNFTVTTNENRVSEIEIYVDSMTLYQKKLEKKTYDLNDAINSYNTTDFDNDNLYLKKYSRKIEQKNILSAPFLIFMIDRVFGSGEHDKIKITTKVKPPTKIVLPGLNPPETQQTLKLSALIVHDGSSPDSGHFRSYLKCGTKWYHYNDVGFKKLEYIGTFKELTKKTDTLKNITQAIYF